MLTGSFVQNFLILHVLMNEYSFLRYLLHFWISEVLLNDLITFLSILVHFGGFGSNQQIQDSESKICLETLRNFYVM